MSCISLADNGLMDVTQLSYTWVGWQDGENFRQLACKFDLNQSERKSSQVNASWELASTLRSWWAGIRNWWILSWQGFIRSLEIPMKYTLDVINCMEGKHKVAWSTQRIQAGNQVLKEAWLLFTHIGKSQSTSVYVYGHSVSLLNSEIPINCLKALSCPGF